jgi:hypothetical protein
MSAAHTVLQHGGRVIVLDKVSFWRFWYCDRLPLSNTVCAAHHVSLHPREHWIVSFARQIECMQSCLCLIGQPWPVASGGHLWPTMWSAVGDQMTQALAMRHIVCIKIARLGLRDCAWWMYQPPPWHSVHPPRAAMHRVFTLAFRCRCSDLFHFLVRTVRAPSAASKHVSRNFISLAFCMHVTKSAHSHSMYAPTLFLVPMHAHVFYCTRVHARMKVAVLRRQLDQGDVRDQRCGVAHAEAQEHC